jgi:arginine-tRNA-protein transferase
MTLPRSHRPKTLSGTELDRFLAIGWYRMGQSIFTTNHIFQGDNTYWVFWLRYFLPGVEFTPKQKKILARNSRFSMEVKPFHLTREHELLYEQYHEGISFDAPPTISSFLYEENGNNVFATSIIELRDGKKLVAAGIFDEGNESIAGIMNFYDPDYAPYSPGKFMMLKKVELAKAAGKKWYYPGYIVQGLPKFDYKLFLGKSLAEIYLPFNNKWVVYNAELANKYATDPFGYVEEFSVKTLPADSSAS